MSTTEQGKVVFTGTSDWWQIVSENEIEIDDGNFDAAAEQAAEIAGTNIDDAESWVAQVTDVAERHSAIKIGDYACCDGYGCDVFFVRLQKVTA